jgi:DNA-binding transcriptional LysR family regulator
MKLFAQVGLRPVIAQVAGEKQTIVNLVAANIGLAIVPRWTSRMTVPGVRYVPLIKDADDIKVLPLAAAWLRGSRDPIRDKLLRILRRRLSSCASEA